MKPFDRADDQKAVVIAVAPAAVPPCMTAKGAVYTRVSGQTLPVTDQRVLADLVAQGRAARGQTEALALRAAERAIGGVGSMPPHSAALSVALCPTQGPEDRAAVLFSENSAIRVRDLVERGLQAIPGSNYSAHHQVGQDVLGVEVASQPTGRGWWALSASWDGAVSAVFAKDADVLNANDVVARVRQAWPVLVEVVGVLGGFGEAHLVVLVRAEHAAFDRWGAHPGPLQRWTQVRKPDEAELRHVERELLRGFGQAAWEPES